MGLQGWRRYGVALAGVALVWAASAVAVAAQAPHRIQPGDTLSEIAAYYGIPLSVLVAENQIADVDRIYAGELLVLPGATAAAAPSTPAIRSGGSLYRVQPGDTLWTIASLRGMTLAALLAANPEILDPHRIYVDQTIALPGLAAGGPPVAPGASADIPALLAQYAAAFGIEASLVQAIAWQESGWQQGVVSSAGAVGVMQVMPATGDWIASDVLGQPLDFRNSTSDNIVAGVAYLRWLIDRSDSLEMALAAYYQGPGSLARHGVYPETRQYIANVLAIRAHILTYGVPPR